MPKNVHLLFPFLAADVVLLLLLKIEDPVVGFSLQVVCITVHVEVLGVAAVTAVGAVGPVVCGPVCGVEGGGPHVSQQ